MDDSPTRIWRNREPRRSSRIEVGFYLLVGFLLGLATCGMLRVLFPKFFA